MAMAHSSAPVAEENEAIKPSPVVFTSEPPCALNASRTRRSCSRSKHSAVGGMRQRIGAVYVGMDLPLP